MLKRVIVMVTLLALIVSVVRAQEVISPALEEQLIVLETTTETIRGLTALEPVERVFPTREETIAYLREVYDRDLPIEEAERSEAFYVALGLLTPDVDLREVYLTLLGSQVAGFYDPDTESMNVIPMVGDDTGDSLSITEQIIYVHEFTHALQDQHFDLAAVLPAELINEPDRALAIRSLVEGDASAVMNVYTQYIATNNPGAALGILLEGLQSGGLFLPPGIPAIFVSELLFPYEQGANFVVSLYNEGGWEAVNAAYTNLPTTSEQIMHPDKYLSGETAFPVDLPDFTPMLGDGWTQVWDVTLGEFYLREQIRSEIAPSRASRAAAGWGGDRFHVYVNGDQVASVLRIAWDTPEDAAEFAQIYAAYADARFGEAGHAGTETDGCWSNASGVLCLATDADGLTWVSSAPTFEQAVILMAF